MARIREAAMDMTRDTLFVSRKFTTGISNTARRHANAKGIKIFWETLTKKHTKKITRNLNPSCTYKGDCLLMIIIKNKNPHAN